MGPLGKLIEHLFVYHATVEIGLSDAWQQRRWSRMKWLLLAAGMALLLAITCIALIVLEVSFANLLILPLILAVFTLIGIYFSWPYATRMIYATHMDATHIWIKGVHPEFLNRLPSWAD
jgi:hypothetical protein